MYENGATRAEAEAQQDARVEDILRQMANEIPTMISDDQVQDPNGESSEESDDKDEKDDDKKSSGEKDKLPTPQVKSKDILEKLHADTDYEVLVRNVDPDVAAKVAEKFHGVAADRQDIREYPNGAIGENIVGRVSMDGQGQFGLEASSDSILTGIDGRSTEDVSANGQAIPGLSLIHI